MTFVRRESPRVHSPMKGADVTMFATPTGRAACRPSILLGHRPGDLAQRDRLMISFMISELPA